MTAPGYPQWIVRRAGWFLLALHLPIVVMPLLLVTTGGMTDHDLAQGVFAVVVIPVMGLLHLRHILAAARGDRPVGWQWTLLAQALLVYLPMPWVGVDWAASTLPLMASAMLMLPGRRGVAIGFGVPFAASGVMYVWQLIAHLNGREQIVESVYFVIIITVFGFALYGTVRLVRLVNELDGTHTELAQLAVDRERVRVSRDLHDLLGQSLSAISLKGDLAIRLLSIDADGARAEIAGLTEVARTALRDVRAVTRDEHRVALREEIAAAAALLAAAGVDTRIDTPNIDLALPGVGEQVLAWAVREGTTNLLRHSAASTATITLARAGGVVRLEMINDRASARAPGAGTGLAGLRERAAALGGATTAGVTPEGGFRLRVTIPATGEVT